MKYITLSVYIFFSLTLYTCSVSKSVVGKYASNKTSDFIELKNDSSFFYENRSFHLYQYSSGKWSIKDGNEVVLTSEVKNTKLPLSVQVVDNEGLFNFLSIKIGLNDGRTLADYRGEIFINDSLFSTKRADSIDHLTINFPIKSIYFRFFKEPDITNTTYIPLPLITEVFNAEKITGKRLLANVVINDKFFYYKSFNNEIAETGKDWIKLYNETNKRWNKVKKVPLKANIFSNFKQ